MPKYMRVINATSIYSAVTIRYGVHLMLMYNGRRGFHVKVQESSWEGVST